MSLLSIITAFRASQCVYAMARLRIADPLAGGPRSVAELASELRIEEARLARLLGALAELGLLERRRDAYSLTELGRPLVDDQEGSVRPLALTVATDYPSWGKLVESLETGRSGFELSHGIELFDLLERDPAARARFDAALSRHSGSPDLACAYDFSQHRIVVDVGGGDGTVIASILAENPRLEGRLLEHPSALGRARSKLEESGLSARCELVPGDFFESVPAGGDFYLLSNVLHDWDDCAALAILRNCRVAMAPDGVIGILEPVLERGSRGSLQDLSMMVITGGGLRTAPEWKELLTAAGLDFEMRPLSRARQLLVCR